MDLSLPMKQPPSSRETSIVDHDGWTMVTIEDRVDAFNSPRLIENIEAIIESEKPFLILNLETTSFMSIPFIKKMSEWSIRLREKSVPMILLKPSEKLKRQIDIFSDLEEFHVSRTEKDLPTKAGTSATL